MLVFFLAGEHKQTRLCFKNENKTCKLDCLVLTCRGIGSIRFFAIKNISLHGMVAEPGPVQLDQVLFDDAPWRIW